MNKIPILLGLLLAVVLFFHGVSQNVIESNIFQKADVAAKIAVRGGLIDENWDLATTANSGYIVLDQNKVENAVEQLFLDNQDVVNQYEIFVINDAPTTFSYLGQSIDFTSNGVVLVYQFNDLTRLRSAEVTDE
ncbi:hypothetical protein BHU72_14765 [Desulfuribacillus stibiiarsenatis]|uniref:Uncharacterized protein n=1 Tax=Desulfuribacillus stibiiarsenatis TaxID=1390249 RepID=A0A1E5L777_9FIRM|nr:hypothetical protein [Desulfuribacillus stibiiarsenatis]OEH86012.1 hypothetical protein BHU72_14765 [Desulfuribacillus stibiiarsenatis]